MENIFWTGPRESDIAYTGEMFEASATYYGSNKEGNSSFCRCNPIRIDHNAYSEEASRFILEWQMDKIQRYPDCRFMSYNPNCVIGAPEEIVRRTLCLNDASLMCKLDNKLEFRKLAEGIVPIVNTKQLLGKECVWDRLNDLDDFKQYDSFVVQETVSSGGHGTYWMTQESAARICKNIDEDEKYLVSGYLYPNIPVNVHVVIYDYDIVILPGSVQIIQLGNDKLLYRGADFIAFRDIEEDLRLKFFALSLKLAEKIQQLGYRGILGIDAMISGKEVYFMEINNRFQGSSILINKALERNGMKSLQEMNYDAFYGGFKKVDYKVDAEQLIVPYSFYTYVNERDGIHSRYIAEAASKEKAVVSMVWDGYDPEQETEAYASQFALIFDTNIVSLCDKATSVRLHPNIGIASEEWQNRIIDHDWSAIKTAVINRGAVLSHAASDYIEAHGKMRMGTYFSLDLYIEGIYMNCPLYVKLTSLSPFLIDRNERGDGLCLKYYGKYLTDVDYDVKRSFPTERLSDGSPIDQICFLATDRLRLQNNSFCTFPAHKCSCRFCEAEGIYNHFGEKEILEAIDVVFSDERYDFRHILIGGLSNDIGKEYSVIMNMCKRIRSYTDMPIYLMCLPPDREKIQAYDSVGVNEFGFNLEVYDRDLAKYYMPGKGRIPLKRYFEAFDAAVECAGAKGAVRCAFIAGLEPMDSLLPGIEEICKRGVAPILSVFRPIPGTDMQDVVPPSDEWLYELMEKAEAICRKYGLTLGPECPACRNNTLTFVHPNEVEQLQISGWKRK